jgi:nucleoside-diphosphate-sugar epimerase
MGSERFASIAASPAAQSPFWITGGARRAMKKLIIGCGYVGSRLAKRWSEEGHQVFATTRTPARAAEFAARGWQPVICDITDAVSIEWPSVDLVAIAVGLDRGSGKSMREVYVDGLRNALAKLPPCRCLYISSTSVYGQTGGEEVDESSETSPQESSGQIVLEAEQVLRMRRPDAVILRFTGIYGPGRLLREHAVRGGKPILANPERWLNLIQIEDGVRAIEAAEALGKFGQIYNVADDEPVRRIDFFKLLAELLSAPVPKLEPSADMNQQHERTNRRISNRRMRRELGVALAYPSFREGLLASVRTGSG